MEKFTRKFKRALLNQDASFSDMYEDANLQNSSSEYLGYIGRHLTKVFGERRVTILDAGCQAGRLLVPLAADGHTVIGLDTSGFALRRAAKHARSYKSNVRFHRGDLSEIRRWVPASGLEVAICAEVLYLCPNYRQLLQLLLDSVKPGGLLCVSHRPAIYYVAKAMHAGKLDLASAMLSRGEGPSPDGTYHNWQTDAQLLELYHALGADVLGRYPVDARSVEIIHDGEHDTAVQAQLAALPRQGMLAQVPAYTLVVAQRRA